MTDEQVVKLSQAIKKDPSDLSKWALPVVTAIVIFFVTGNQSKTDTAQITLSALSQQISALSSSFDDLKIEVRGVQAQLTTARIDPFTGSMGVELRSAMIDKIEGERDLYNTKIDKLEDRIHHLESLINQQQFKNQ